MTAELSSSQLPLATGGTIDFNTSYIRQANGGKDTHTMHWRQFHIAKEKGRGGGGRREGALVKRGKVGVGGGGRGGKVRVRREGGSEEGRWE